jgi:uncharacterized protein YcbK (DUF882 family)
MSQFFTLKELTYSGTALLKKINNTPNEAVKVNLEILMEQLDKIRAKWGRPIYVNSGYRCPELNKAVGGVKTSQHQLGVAADITTKNATLDKQLYDMIVQNFDYDQCIWEKSGSSVWIHYSYVRPNRKLKLSIIK